MQLEARIDDALTRIHNHADENARGFTSHAPMVVDALVALGREDHIEPFLDAYLPDFPALDLRPEPDDEWAELLDPGCDWRTVLEHALADLAPSFFAAATHGPIRTAHATRMLEAADTPARRRELGRALGYWRTTAATLPGTPGAGPTPDLTATDLLAQLEVVPNEQRTFGLFTESVAALDEHPPFVEAIERLAVPEEVGGDAVGDVTRTMLGPYFESPLLRIAYVHTITAPSALRLLGRHVAPATLRVLYGFGVQAVAALHAVSYLPTRDAPGAGPARLARDVETLKTRAADTLEEHVIKFTEACLREHAATGETRFLLAAADATRAEEVRAEGARAQSRGMSEVRTTRTAGSG